MGHERFFVCIPNYFFWRFYSTFAGQHQQLTGKKRLPTNYTTTSHNENARMNGQSGNDSASQEAQLAMLLNAAGQNSLMGLTGAAGGRFGVPDASLEEQILQRASALRTEALMAQQQRQRGLGAGLSVAALQQQQHLLHQQQQLSALAGMSPSLGALGSQEQEAILARAAALRELGIGGIPGGLHGAGGMDRLQQLELGRLEELERRRKQIAALTGLGGGASSELGVESAKSGASDIAIADKAKEMFRKKQEDLRKTPGTVIVPCRARGMPMDHNFKVSFELVGILQMFEFLIFPLF